MSGVFGAVAARFGSQVLKWVDRWCLCRVRQIGDPTSIPVGFDAVKAEFKSAPGVVEHNNVALRPPVNNDHFSIPTESLATDLNTNTVRLRSC